MNTIEVLNSFFVLPAIKAGIAQKVWEHKEGSLLNIWEKLGLINSEGLTKLGSELSDLSPLVDYFSSLWGDYSTVEFGKIKKIDDRQYSMLREGLSVFHSQNNISLFSTLSLVNKKWHVLDYCGGDGQYLRSFLSSNLESSGMLVDRKAASGLDSIAVDYEATPDWYLSHKEKFDLIILSEILHCKGKAGQVYLIDSARYMLKPGGLLLVNEVIPCPFFDWRMSIYTRGGASISIEEVKNMTLEKWEIMKELPEGCNPSTKYHYQMLLKKTEG